MPKEEKGKKSSVSTFHREILGDTSKMTSSLNFMKVDLTN